MPVQDVQFALIKDFYPYKQGGGFYLVDGKTADAGDYPSKPIRIKVSKPDHAEYVVLDGPVNVTKKKNIAINASFIQWITDNFNPKLLIPINKYLFNVEKYNSDRSELLIINATIAANKRTSPLAASSLKNHLKGLDI